MPQCTAVWYSVLQCVAVCCSVLQWLVRQRNEACATHECVMLPTLMSHVTWVHCKREKHRCEQCAEVVCCNVLQYAAVYCSVLQSGIVWCSLLQCVDVKHYLWHRRSDTTRKCAVLECAAVCCSVLQCATTCWSVLECAAVCCSVLQWLVLRDTEEA